MGRNDRRNRKGKNKNNWNSRQEQSKHFFNTESPAEIAERENAIREFKAKENICPACGKPIMDIAEAIADKTTGQPVHFDCVLNTLRQDEKLEAGRQIAYIGQGRFAVVAFGRDHENKKFQIEKIIEWEDKNKTSSWRGEMADLYSKVK